MCFKIAIIIMSLKVKERFTYTCISLIYMLIKCIQKYLTKSMISVFTQYKKTMKFSVIN